MVTIQHFKRPAAIIHICLCCMLIVSCSKEENNLVSGPRPELLGMMVDIPAGRFIRGSEYGLDIERPMDTITLENDFSMGVAEVTNFEFCEFLNAAGVDATG